MSSLRLQEDLNLSPLRDFYHPTTQEIRNQMANAFSFGTICMGLQLVY